MNIKYVGFLDSGFQGKNLCECVYFPLYLFSYFTKNMFALNNCTRLKSTFGIRVVIGLRGMPLCLGVWLKSMVNLVTIGSIWY